MHDASSISRVLCFLSADVGNYHYGPGHPMKPHRIRMTHSLLLNYGLYSKMDMFQPPRATANDMTKFHSDDYISFLRRVSPDNIEDLQKQLQRCTLASSALSIRAGKMLTTCTKIVNVGEDCPVFHGMYEFCQISAGGSLGTRFFLPFFPFVLGLMIARRFRSRRHQDQPRASRHLRQLGWRSASREKVRGIGLLLCQRHCPGDPRDAQVSPTRALH